MSFSNEDIGVVNDLFQSRFGEAMKPYEAQLHAVADVVDQLSGLPATMRRLESRLLDGQAQVMRPIERRIAERMQMATAYAAQAQSDLRRLRYEARVQSTEPVFDALQEFNANRVMLKAEDLAGKIQAGTDVKDLGLTDDQWASFMREMNVVRTTGRVTFVEQAANQPTKPLVVGASTGLLFGVVLFGLASGSASVAIIAGIAGAALGAGTAWLLCNNSLAHFANA